MSKIPTPRSYNQILGDMLDSFTSRSGIARLKRGSPTLSLLEAAAQSDLRNVQDLFGMLNSISLDRAEGIALRRIGEGEGIPQIGAAPATGRVTFWDNSFTRIATSIYQGLSGPIVGATVVHIANGADFPSSGQVYLGRGTANYEGPISYSALVDNASHWTMTLDTPTQKYHNQGESVVLAQGGNRPIPSGTLVGTTGAEGVEFSTLYAAQIPDGETAVGGVRVICSVPGTRGNVSKGAINRVISEPFAGAQVVNPLPLINGQDTESDDTYRERIRHVRQSRVLGGVPLAIKTALHGATTPDEGKRIISSSLVARQGTPHTIYIDDGTGYEEVTLGVAHEVLVASAIGGEQLFQVSAPRPVSRAYITSMLTAPFELQSGDTISVQVGDAIDTHTFVAHDFLDIYNASGYGVVSSINSNTQLGFKARTSDSGRRVTLTSKGRVDESIRIIDSDTNRVFEFPTSPVDTMYLYRNDVLLSRNGSTAKIVGNLFSQWDWSTLSGPQTLELSVDNTPVVTYTITDDHFTTHTNFTSVGPNTLEAWATVLEAIIPGINVSIEEGRLVVRSNRTLSAQSALAIEGGTLVDNSMFEVRSSVGASADYILNRNLGQIELMAPLSPGDRLTLGSMHTRAFSESEEIELLDLDTDIRSWIAVDGDISIVPIGVTAGMNFEGDVVDPSSGGDYYVVQLEGGADVFEHVQVGDWLLIWDSDAPPEWHGAWRIANRNDDWVEVETEDDTGLVDTWTFSHLGIAVVRTDSELQQVTVPTDNDYVTSSLANIFNSEIYGATVHPHRTRYLRARTNTYNPTGSVALIASELDSEGRGMHFSSSLYRTNDTGHVGFVESGKSDVAVPNFTFYDVDAVVGGETITPLPVPTQPGGLVGVHSVALAVDTALPRYGHQRGLYSRIADIDAPNIVLDRSGRWVPQDRAYLSPHYSFGVNDSLVVLLDEDIGARRFAVPLSRRVRATVPTYGEPSYDLVEYDTHSSLVAPFGDDFDFGGFNVHMKAKTIIHDDESQSILWKFKRPGPEGEAFSLRYRYPKAPDTEVELSSYLTTDRYRLGIHLPGGEEIDDSNIRPSSRIGWHINDDGVVTMMSRLDVEDVFVNDNVARIVFGYPAHITNHGLSMGDVIYFHSSHPDVHIPSGAYTITNVPHVAEIWFAVAVADHEALGLAGTDTSVSFDPHGPVDLSSGGAVGIGDIVHIQDSSQLDYPLDGLRGQNMRVSAAALMPERQWLECSFDSFSVDPPSAPPTGTLTWTPLYGLIRFSEAPTISVADLIEAVDEIAHSPVEGVALGDDTSEITQATVDHYNVGTWFDLVDGFNWIQEASISGDHYEFTWGDSWTLSPVDPDAVLWEDEELWLIPSNTPNVVDWMNALGVTGLSSVASVEASSRGRHVQIATDTPGSQGSVQIQGGLGNATSASIVDSMSENHRVVSIPSGLARGLVGNSYVAIDNATPLLKSYTFLDSTVIEEITANGVMLIQGSGSSPLQVESPDDSDNPLSAENWYIERHGDFVAYFRRTDNLSPLDEVVEGSIVVISEYGTSPASEHNRGIFRVVRVEAGSAYHGFWIENPQAVEEREVGLTARFLDYQTSIVPGDYLSINSDLLGPSNRGVWRVLDVVDGVDPAEIHLEGISPVSTSTPISGEVANFRILGPPARLIKQIETVFPHPTNPEWSSIRFTTSEGFRQVTKAAGSVLTALGKLNFAPGTFYGSDGYRHSIGLIGEANRILYGDFQDTMNYPGVAAFGVNIDVEGPTVRRIAVDLALRIKTGLSISTIASAVRSAVAAVVNEAEIGTPIAISSIVAACKGVSGVISVAVSAPEYGVGSDLLAVQPYEKPLVLDVDQDIRISFIGEST